MEYLQNDPGRIVTDSVIRKIDGRQTGDGSHSHYLIYSILARQCSSEQSLLSLDPTSVLQDQDFLDFVQGPLNSDLVLVNPKPISLNTVRGIRLSGRYDPDARLCSLTLVMRPSKNTCPATTLVALHL